MTNGRGHTSVCRPKRGLMFRYCGTNSLSYIKREANVVSPLKALWIIALLAAFPLFAQEPVAGTEEEGDAAAVEQPADTQEEAATVEKKEEEKKAEETAGTAEKKEEAAPAAPAPVAAPVAEPVPAVVGIAMSGERSCVMVCAPE